MANVLRDDDSLAAAMTLLSDREQTVLDLRLGLAGGEGMTLDEIGGRLGVTRERVRQLETRALKTPCAGIGFRTVLF